jgi:hypothetical protein
LKKEETDHTGMKFNGHINKISTHMNSLFNFVVLEKNKTLMVYVAQHRFESRLLREGIYYYYCVLCVIDGRRNRFVEL